MLKSKSVSSTETGSDDKLITVTFAEKDGDWIV